jgi:hypothetical protein
MTLQVIENLARLIMEWAMKKRDNNQRPIVEEIAEGSSYYAPRPHRTSNPHDYLQLLRTERAKKALL